MRASIRSLECVAALLLCLALMNGAQAAVRKGSMVRITLQNGTTVLGEVVSETSLGLLISNGSKTELVPFANVKTVDDLTPASAEPPPPPPPLTDDEPLPAPKRAANISEERKLRFGVGVNGGAADGYYGVGWLVGAEFVVSFNLTEWFNLRVLANYTHTQNGPYSTNLGLAIAMPIIWFGVYGLGVAVAVGAGNVTYGRLGAAVGAFASPVRLKFGKSIAHEFSLDLGAVFITSSSRGVDPFGRISYTVLF